MFKPIYKNDEERKKARITSIKKYQKSRTTIYSFRFHNEYDKKVIEKLNSQANKADYIGQLILNDEKQ